MGNFTMITRVFVKPDALDLDTPGRRDYWVTFEHDKNWADHLMPVTVLVGPNARRGKGMLCTGATHGNEYEGPIAIKHLVGKINIKDVTGRIILIPVLNMAAFRTGTRDSVADDNANLNRAFVEGAGIHPAISGITHRIARFVREKLFPAVDVVMDFHAGGQVANFSRCISFHQLDDPKQMATMYETALKFDLPFIVTYQNQTPGLLTSDAERAGKITLGAELGHGESIDHRGVQAAFDGILSAALMHGHLRKNAMKTAKIQHKPRFVEMVKRECFVLCPRAGHYEALVSPGTYVKKGQLLGYLHDFERIDDEPLEMKAGTEGWLLVQAWRAPVTQGQWVIVVANEIDPPKF